jgi:dipeptide/tripeptide permease
MSEEVKAATAAEVPVAAGENILKHTLREITQPFIDLFKASRALWGINISYLIEGLTYFGVVGLLAIYFNNYVHLDDISAGWMVSFQTGGITLAMLLLGATVDLVGVRRAIMVSLVFMLAGRVVLAASPTIGGGSGLWSPTHILSMLGILGVILGYGIYQPE